MGDSDHHITKGDLRQFSKDIKDHVSTTVKPLRDDIDSHHVTLHGEDARGGVVADVNDIKSGVTVAKAIAGTGLLGVIIGWIKSIWP